MPTYEMRRLVGVDGEELVVHMCLSKGGDSVELLIGDEKKVVITRCQFDVMAHWIAGQFERLASRPPDVVH